MKKVIGFIFALLFFASFVFAASSSSSIKTNFVVADASENSEFYSVEEYEAMQSADLVDVAVFVGGGVLVLIVLTLIIVKWLGKGKKKLKKRREKSVRKKSKKRKK